MLTDVLSTSVQPRVFSAWLFSTFGIAALLITGVGILDLVAMTTNRRTKEIGIRMALGATLSIVTLQIVREHLWSVAVGLAVGGLVAAALVRFVAAYLYKTPVSDRKKPAPGRFRAPSRNSGGAPLPPSPALALEGCLCDHVKHHRGAGRLALAVAHDELKHVFAGIEVRGVHFDRFWKSGRSSIR